MSCPAQTVGEAVGVCGKLFPREVVSVDIENSSLVFRDYNPHITQVTVFHTTLRLPPQFVPDKTGSVVVRVGDLLSLSHWPD